MERVAGSGMTDEARKPCGLHCPVTDRACQRRRFRRVAVWIIAALLIAHYPGLVAKEKKPSRTVTGLVSDASENPISGAVVTLTDLSDGKKTATFTSQNGTYHFSDLEQTRDYEIQATYKGDSSRVRKVSSIDPRNRIVLNLRIPPPQEEE